jgi:hypothetical protein
MCTRPRDIMSHIKASAGDVMLAKEEIKIGQTKKKWKSNEKFRSLQSQKPKSWIRGLLWNPLNFKKRWHIWLMTIPKTDWYSGNDLDFYSGGTRFESRLRHRLSCLRYFADFLIPFRQGIICPSGHDRFLSYSLLASHRSLFGAA